MHILSLSFFVVLLSLGQLNAELRRDDKVSEEFLLICGTNIIAIFIYV